MFVLAALVIALTSPSAAPKPAPTNPFTLEAVPRSSPLPVIGTTRSRPVCVALRRAVRPALESAMRNDTVYGGMRKTIYDYFVKDSEDARDLRLMQMDRKVQDLVKSTDALNDAVNDSSLTVASNARGDDAKTIGGLRKSLSDVLAAQRVQLDVMSGFVQTEQARRFGRLNESEQNLQQAAAPAGAQLPQVSAFLNDTSDAFNGLKHPTPAGLAGGRKVDEDLGQIAAFTAAKEVLATQAIVTAAGTCR